MHFSASDLIKLLHMANIFAGARLFDAFYNVPSNLYVANKI